MLHYGQVVVLLATVESTKTGNKAQLRQINAFYKLIQWKYYLAFGQIETNWSLNKLLSLFDRNYAQIRESSHYEDERYLLIEASQGAQVSFERIAKDEILIRGDATTKEQLIVICKSVSTVLASHQLKHRIELYDEKICCMIITITLGP